ncbi:MAG TPA: DUF996 domain-containing protein [Candidatus Acidoferrales bacterium]|nr:DUF996 domain-containing protein [Candidatus Acidoferrales bacterium]
MKNSTPTGTSHTLESVKTIGGVGSILALLAFVPNVGFLLAIAGLIMVLLALKYASDIFGDPKIFNDMLYAVILGIVGLVVGAVAVVAVVFRAIGMGYMSSSFAYTGPSSVASSDILGMLGTILLGLVAVWACFLVSSIFLRRSYGELGRRVNVSLFGTAALLYFIGAVLTIILVGFLLIFVADILFIVAFFSINTQMPASNPVVQPAQPSV